MALALYRKYRPRTFSEIIGQEHVTEPLIQALKTGRLNHAYLFSGPRGCGKTSSARILARSLNCAQGPTPEPCGECDSCRALAPDGPGSIDVIEIDAASHGGVDDARELRERAFFAPAISRYKIYIIDEAHMVSSAGFNALLKLVEEPPDYVKFVFATTEPDKVLGTIKSRTHHYPFRLIPPSVMRPYLEQLCGLEGVQVEAQVFPLVVRAGGGSGRDSLSVLDQLIAGSGTEGVKYSQAVSLLGVTDVALLDDMVDALAAGDGAAAFGTIDRVAEAGHDSRRFASDLLQRLRDLIILRRLPDAAEKGMLDAPDDELARMKAQSGQLGDATLSRCADIIHNGLVEMRGATSPRLLLELLVARMLLPAADDSASAVLQRLERLESGAPASGLAAARAPAAPAAPAPATPSTSTAPSGSTASGSTASGSRASGNAGLGGTASGNVGSGSTGSGSTGSGNVGPGDAGSDAGSPGNAGSGGVSSGRGPSGSGPGGVGSGGVSSGGPVAAPGATQASPVVEAAPAPVQAAPVAEPALAASVHSGQSFAPGGQAEAAPAAGSGSGGVDAATVRRSWDEVVRMVGRGSKKAAAFAREGVVRDIDGQALILLFKHKIHADGVSADPQPLLEAIREVIGGSWSIRCEVGGDQRPVTTQSAPAARQPSAPSASLSPAAPSAAAPASDDDWPAMPATVTAPAPAPAAAPTAGTPRLPQRDRATASQRPSPAKAAIKTAAAAPAAEDFGPDEEPPYDEEFDEIVDAGTAHMTSEQQALDSLRKSFEVEKIADLGTP